ncbi:cholesterol esterase [Amycolatopsis rhizosphaerae]|uniref:Cholesterol esterase n=1 Tax=Amycolatopsis rhizosphaerae TaxID=2053003 RepID=A0A558BWR2_9PSEU|nr:DUF6230 family protein [Amycolatopsis rhizosphaerae]TVT40958.1 cholesterol esterase [Amycolatopsis rhizosphaerae]
MTDVPERPAGRIRWRRFLGIFAAGAIGAGGIMVAIAQEALAVSFAVAGTPLKTTADQLNGYGFVAYGAIDHEINGRLHPVLVNAFRRATLDNFCQSVTTPVPILGSVTLRTTAPHVYAENLGVDVELILGTVTYHDVEINRDASTLTDGPPGARGVPGTSGTQAAAVNVKDLRQIAWATVADTLRLSDSKTIVLIGNHPCF